MNWTKYIIPVLKQTDFVLAGISLLIIIFYRFFIKAQFVKHANLKWYAMLSYSFVGLIISSISYVLLNAQTLFFNLNSIYKTYWFFAVYLLLSVGISYLIAWLIFNAARLVNLQKSYQLTNYSLIIIAPTLLYVLLFKPFIDNFEYTGLKKPEVFIDPNQIQTEEKLYLYNPQNFTITSKSPDISLIPAIPFQLYDSLNLQINNGSHVSFTLGSAYNFKLDFKATGIEQVYVAALGNYLALLGVSSPVYAVSSLLIIDNTATPVFQKIYHNGVNRMAANKSLQTLVLTKSIADKTEFVEALKVE
ncbi:MAG: hypothetical protein ACK4K9_03945 [Bacteroidia bacterium]